MGVEPRLFLRCGSAPPSRSAFTAAAQRTRTARCRGVTPLLSRELGSAPASEASHRRRLCRRIPCARTRETISGIVKGFGTTAIPRANHGTHTYQLSRGLFPVSGGCEVQCGIARIDIVADLFEVIGFGRMASCSLFEMSSCQFRI